VGGRVTCPALWAVLNISSQIRSTLPTGRSCHLYTSYTFCCSEQYFMPFFGHARPVLLAVLQAIGCDGKIQLLTDKSAPLGQEVLCKALACGMPGPEQIISGQNVSSVKRI